MSDRLIFKGLMYEAEDSASSEYVNPKETEADQEIELADKIKEANARKYGKLKGLVNMFYDRYVSKYSSEDDMRRLLRATYEIIGKRYLEAKRKHSELTKDWAKLIHHIPGIFVTPTMEAEYSHPIDSLVEQYFYVLNDVNKATAFVMAISLRLNILASEHPEEEFDEIKDQADTFIYSMPR